MFIVLREGGCEFAREPAAHRGGSSTSYSNDMPPDPATTCELPGLPDLSCYLKLTNAVLNTFHYVLLLR